MWDCQYKKNKLRKFSPNDENDKKLLNAVFGYKGDAKKIDKYKVILIEESFSKDKKENINDEELFNDVIKTVGSENVIIKHHPRVTKNRFKNCEVLESNLPWEIIQMNGNFKDKIFITISSGAVLSSKIWLEDCVKAYFCFNCVNKKPKMLDENYMTFFAKMNNKFHPEMWIIPNSKFELLKFLREEV